MEEAQCRVWGVECLAAAAKIGVEREVAIGGKSRPADLLLRDFEEEPVAVDVCVVHPTPVSRSVWGVNAVAKREEHKLLYMCGRGLHV